MLSHCVLYVVNSEIVRTFYIGYFFFPVKIYYLMSYSTVYGCVAKVSYFSVHHKFSIF